MTYEEAKETLELIKVMDAPNLREAIDLGISALKKQIPKKPMIWENHSYYEPSPNDDWGYECPCCGNKDIDYPDHHCECGQALDWSEDNE